MTSLKIIRNSEFVAKYRKFKIMLNDENMGTIKTGETIEVPVQPGNHELYLKIDWCGSNTIKFSTKEREQLQYRVCYRGDWFNIIQALYFMIFKPYKFLLLEKVDHLHET